MSETLEVGGLSFDVRRSPRRRTLALIVDRGAELVIHAPEVTRTEELARWTRSKLLWVHRKLAIKEHLASRVREPEFVAGERFGYLGRSYRLAISTRQDKPLIFDGRGFSLRADARSSAPDHFRLWYVTVGKPWIARRAKLLAARTGMAPSRIEVGDLGYRWGSCGKHRVVFFNWTMLQLPVRLVDYVIVHELGHLLIRNHGPAFSSLLDRCLPDWRSRKEQLTTRAQEIFWCQAHARRMAVALEDGVRAEGAKD